MLPKRGILKGRARMIEQQVLLSVSCPGCKTTHDIAVPRLWLKNEVESDRDVGLYCIHSNASWKMTEDEKRNTRKAFSDLIL